MFLVDPVLSVCDTKHQTIKASIWKPHFTPWDVFFKISLLGIKDSRGIIISCVNANKAVETDVLTCGGEKCFKMGSFYIDSSIGVCLGALLTIFITVAKSVWHFSKMKLWSI